MILPFHLPVQSPSEDWGWAGLRITSRCHTIGWLHRATSRHILATVYNNIDYPSPSHKNGKGKKCESHISFYFLPSPPHLLSTSALKCTPQTQSHLQFTPFYLAGSLGLYTDVPPTWPFNTILSAHCMFSQHSTKYQV